MIRRAWGRLVSSRQMREVLVAERVALKLSQRLQALVKRLDKRQREMKALQTRFSFLAKSAEEDTQNARDTATQYSEAIEALRSENQILRDVTVPTLVAQHKLILQRIDAETAIEVQRLVALSSTEVER